MSQLKKIIYNCRQATLLIEKKQLNKLTIREQVELRIHLVGCSFCRLYDSQSHIINAMVQQLFHNSTNSGIRLDDNFKKELQERIEEELKRHE
jgi:hypothetical protein